MDDDLHLRAPREDASGVAVDPHRAGEPMVVVDGLSKSYISEGGHVPALSNMSFSAMPGEFVALLGPSGCGKSSLLMIVAGLRGKSSGVVKVNSRSVERPQTDIGIVFQTDVLLDWRSNLDNVLLQIEFRRLQRSAYVQRAVDLLDSVGLAGFEHRRPYELSGGMRQRVAICRALIHDPPLLLMDEPFGALDALTRDQMALDLQAIWMRTHKTVLFVTHSIIEAVMLADRVILMTPRPGTVDHVYGIELPRPRTVEMVATPAFNGYAAQIRKDLQERGVIHDVAIET